MKKLQDKVAVITGAARGIGKATAEKFLLEGAAIALWDIDAQVGQATTTALQAKGQKVCFYQVDTSNRAAVEQAVQQVVEELGSLDILVNNAGITRDASLKKMTSEQWQQVIDVNLTGVFNCTKAVYPFMSQKGFGRILNAASVVAHYGNFGQSNYVATKAGVIGLTKVWARGIWTKRHHRQRSGTGLYRY